MYVGSPAEGVELKRRINSVDKKVLLATNTSTALDIYKEYPVDVVFIDLLLTYDDVVSFVKNIREVKHRSTVINLLVNGKINDGRLEQCMEYGADDFLIKPVKENILQARLSAISRKLQQDKKIRETMVEQEVAKDIFETAIDYRNIDVQGIQSFNRPADIFSGDLVLTSKTPNGEVYVLLADFTGHGLSAAIAVLPVFYVFGNKVKRGDSVESILRNINEKLMLLLPTSMFMACCIIKVSMSERKIYAWNAGMPDIYFTGDDGSITKRVESSCIPLGVTDLDEDKMQFENIKIDDCGHIVMTSDGLTDAINDNGEMFGTERLEALIEDSGSDLHDNIIETYSNFCGEGKPRDDMSLVTLSLNDILS